MSKPVLIKRPVAFRVPRVRAFTSATANAVAPIFGISGMIIFGAGAAIGFVLIAAVAIDWVVDFGKLHGPAAALGLVCAIGAALVGCGFALSEVGRSRS